MAPEQRAVVKVSGREGKPRVGKIRVAPVYLVIILLFSFDVVL